MRDPRNARLAHLIVHHSVRLQPGEAVLIEAFDLREYSLVISSSHCVAKGVIPGPDALHLSYVHSPVRYAWNQYHAYFSPGRLSPVRRLIVPRAIHRLRIWDVTASARVDHFIANSANVARRIRRYYRRDAEVIVNAVFEAMTEALCSGERIEIRGFGSFVVKQRRAREGRNPKTGDIVAVAAKRVPFFKVGKELKQRVDKDETSSTPPTAAPITAPVSQASTVASGGSRSV